MCAGAVLQTRLAALVWGAANPLLGADGAAAGRCAICPSRVSRSKGVKPTSLVVCRELGEHPQASVRPRGRRRAAVHLFFLLL